MRGGGSGLPGASPAKTRPQMGPTWGITITWGCPRCTYHCPTGGLPDLHPYPISRSRPARGRGALTSESDGQQFQLKFQIQYQSTEVDIFGRCAHPHAAGPAGVWNRRFGVGNVTLASGPARPDPKSPKPLGRLK